MPRQILTETISDAYIRDTLAKIDGVYHGTQRLDQAVFHPFPARMPLVIAEFIIERLSTPGALVLDPMVGSGATLIAAKKLGRSGIGFDLDPLAIRLARARTLTFDPILLKDAGDRVYVRAVERLRAAATRFEQPMWFCEADKAFLDYWFPSRSQQELGVLASAIQDERNPTVQDFLWAVFSSLIIAKSAGASYARDLAHSRPRRDLKKPVRWPLETWTSRFNRALQQLALPHDGEAFGKSEVRSGDAGQLDLPDATVDLILTSPPYLSANRTAYPAIDYIRAHKFSLVWMDYHLATLKQMRATLLGTGHGLPRPNGLPAVVEQGLSQSVPWPGTRGRIRRYLSDLHSVLAEIRRVLKPGALAVFIVAPALMSRTRHDAAEVIGEMAQSTGLVVVDVAVRKLDARRRSLPPPRHLPGAFRSIRAAAPLKQR